MKPTDLKEQQLVEQETPFFSHMAAAAGESWLSKEDQAHWKHSTALCIYCWLVDCLFLSPRLATRVFRVSYLQSAVGWPSQLCTSTCASQGYFQYSLWLRFCQSCIPYSLEEPVLLSTILCFRSWLAWPVLEVLLGVALGFSWDICWLLWSDWWKVTFCQET